MMAVWSPPPTMRTLSYLVRRFALIVILLSATFAFAQESGMSERSIGPSGPPPEAENEPQVPSDTPPLSTPHERSASPRTNAASTSNSAGMPNAAASGAAEKPATLPAAHKYFPYTVKPGESLGGLAQYFGVPVADLAHANRMHEDDELLAGQTLKIPNPFEASQKNLRSQVDQLSAEARENQRKLEQAEAQVTSLSSRDADLGSENATLRDAVRALPWWRGTALGLATAALLMFGVTVLTLFEWWRIRRRFIALSDLSLSLGRLDVKYKEMLAKAELRMQQLYGRRRPAGDSAQHGPKTADEIEIERLNHELREMLEHHLERLGVRGAGSRRRSRLRELVAAEEEPSVEPRTIPR